MQDAEKKKKKKDLDEIITEINYYNENAFSLDDEQVKILAVRIKHPTISAAGIARGLKIERKKVERTLKNPCFVYEYQKYVRETAENMRLAAARASVRVLELIDHENPKIALKAAEMALSPWINQQKLVVDVKPNVIFRTNVDQSGNLVREVLELELHEDGNKFVMQNSKADENLDDPMGGIE